MRLHLAALLAALAPACAAGQTAPRSLAVEVAFSNDSAAALGSRAPVALVGSWWLAGELDATARLAWASAARTGGRAADSAYEAGLGLRYGLARWASLRPQVTLDAALVEVAAGAIWGGDSGLRLGVGLGLEAFLARDLSLALVLQGSELLLPSGGGLGAAASLRGSFYF